MFKAVLVLVLVLIFQPVFAGGEKCIGPVTATADGCKTFNFYNEFDDYFTFTAAQSGSNTVTLTARNYGDTAYRIPNNRYSAAGGTALTPLTSGGFQQFDGPWAEVRVCISSYVSGSAIYNICGKGN